MSWLQTICCFHLFPKQLSVSNVLVTDYLLFPSVCQTTFSVKCLGYRLFAISICFPDNFLCLGYRQFAVSRLFAVLTVWASGLQRLPRACSMLRSAVTELCCEQTRNVRREILTHIFLLTTSHRGRVNLHFTRSATLTKQPKECHRGWWSLEIVCGVEHAAAAAVRDRRSANPERMRTKM